MWQGRVALGASRPPLCRLLRSRVRLGRQTDGAQSPRAPDRRLRGAPFQDLIVAVTQFLVFLIYPETCAIDDVGQLFAVVRQELHRLEGESAGSDPVMITKIRQWFAFR